MLFRSMTPADDGLPRVARSARALGVRVPEDVRTDVEGQVGPGTGGMSVAPSSMWNLPHHRRPRGMGRGSTGPVSDRVFGVEEAPLAEARLAVRPDPDRPDKHAFVEPVARVGLADYESALASTRPRWVRTWP